MPDQLEFEYDVFISYSSHNKDWVRGTLLKKIEEAGQRVLIDFRDFKRGAPSIKEMERAVTSCRKTLLVLTPEYLKSEWCEIEHIMLQTLGPANRELRLIPLLKAECERPLHIAVLTHIDFTEGSDTLLAWHQLLTALDVSPNKPDPEKIPAEIQLQLDRAKSLIDIDKFAEAIPILEEVLKIANDANHIEAKIEARLQLANALHEAREDFSGAERQYRDALILVPIDRLSLKHSVILGLGNMLLLSGRLNEARATLETGLTIARRSGKISDLAASLGSLGLVDHDLGLLDSAAAKLDEMEQLLLRQALALPQGDDRKQNSHALGACYHNKAILYHNSGDFEQAFAFCRLAEEQHSLSGDKLNAGKALLFRGNLHCADAAWDLGFECFKGAMLLFIEVGNPLWVARCAAKLCELYSTHENWEEAVKAAFTAVAGAKEAKHPGEQVHFLCLASQVLRRWKISSAKDDVSRKIHRLAKDTPPDTKAEVMSLMSAQMEEVNDSIESNIRQDEEVLELLSLAKDIAQKAGLRRHLANCLIEEAHRDVSPSETAKRRGLVEESIDLLKLELMEAHSQKWRGHLMRQLSELHWELGQVREAIACIRKAEEIFKRNGDLLGLANLEASLAEIHRSEGRPDEEIAAYRGVLQSIEGRSFPRLAAGVRIRLAAALHTRGEFGEVEKLLSDAEEICNRHHFRDLISAIAYHRSKTESEIEAAQAPTLDLPELLMSLGELLKYRPEHEVAYLAFWCFSWKSELLALLRSGPRLSFMIVTDDVARFKTLAGRLGKLADYFLMGTSQVPVIETTTEILSIPPTWKFPLSFPLILMKSEGAFGASGASPEHDDSPPRILLTGPATQLPPYMPVEAKSEVKGEGHMMPLGITRFPLAGIELMTKSPTEELIRLNAVWFPTLRFSSKDPVLHDLLISYDRGVFPVYLGSQPNSNAVKVCGGVEFSVPSKFLNEGNSSMAAKWRRALLKLTKVPKDRAAAMLLDLPEVFGDGCESETTATIMEIRLLEFKRVDRLIVYPAIVLRQ